MSVLSNKIVEHIPQNLLRGITKSIQRGKG